MKQSKLVTDLKSVAFDERNNTWYVVVFDGDDALLLRGDYFQLTELQRNPLADVQNDARQFKFNGIVIRDDFGKPLYEDTLSYQGEMIHEDGKGRWLPRCHAEHYMLVAHPEAGYSLRCLNDVYADIVSYAVSDASESFALVKHGDVYTFYYGLPYKTALCMQSSIMEGDLEQLGYRHTGKPIIRFNAEDVLYEDNALRNTAQCNHRRLRRLDPRSIRLVHDGDAMRIVHTDQPRPRSFLARLLLGRA